MRTFTQHRDHQVRVITIVITLVCGIGSISAVVPAVEHAINLGLLCLGGLLALGVLARTGARRLRERREDREDAITAAAWRATHRPVRVHAGARGVS